jgi:hypothetical protein
MPIYKAPVEDVNFLLNDVFFLALVPFVAILPGSGRDRLTFTQFLDYMQRLRRVAPDFGQDATLLGILAQGRILAALYRMSFTLARYPGEPVTYTSTDWVKFDPNGNIVELHVIYDRTDTLGQVEQVLTSGHDH